METKSLILNWIHLKKCLLEGLDDIALSLKKVESIKNIENKLSQKTNLGYKMTKNQKILLLPGDGIGPEVVRETKKVIEWFNKNKSLDFKIDQDLIGGAAIDTWSSYYR